MKMELWCGSADIENPESICSLKTRLMRIEAKGPCGFITSQLDWFKVGHRFPSGEIGLFRWQYPIFAPCAEVYPKFYQISGSPGSADRQPTSIEVMELKCWPASVSSPCNFVNHEVRMNAVSPLFTAGMGRVCPLMPGDHIPEDWFDKALSHLASHNISFTKFNSSPAELVDRLSVRYATRKLSFGHHHGCKWSMSLPIKSSNQILRMESPYIRRKRIERLVDPLYVMSFFLAWR